MSANDEELQRVRLLGRLRAYLLRRRSPRAILSRIMAATALAGFIASFGMLKLGLDAMWLRYPLAVLVAWSVFLGLMRWWAESERDSLRPDEELGAIEPVEGSETAERKSVWTGRAPETRRGRSSWLDWLDFPDLDPEGCLAGLVLLLLVGFAVGAVMAIGGLFMEAETVLAEVLLDALLVSALYRRLRKHEADWWLNGAFRHTVKPVLLTIGFLGVAGLVFHYYAPEAKSIGGVWRHREIALPR